MNEAVNTSPHKSIGLSRLHDKSEFCLGLRNLSTVISTSSYLVLVQAKDRGACLRYLRNESVQKDLQTQGGNRPFVDYAVHSWYRHVSVTGDRYAELSQIATDFFVSDSPSWNLWRLRFHQLWSLDYSEDECSGQDLPSPTYYAAFFGLEETISYLHSKDPDSINAIGGAHGTSIKAAYVAGHLKLTARLEDLGANLNVAVGRYLTGSLCLFFTVELP